MNAAFLLAAAVLQTAVTLGGAAASLSLLRAHGRVASLSQESDSNEKPPRFARSGGTGEGGKHDDEGGTPLDDLHCGVTMKVGSKNNKAVRCPQECPFYAQDKTDNDFCTFTCVDEAGCTQKNPAKQIGDNELGVCRSCIVEGCSECDASTTQDVCAKCQAGWYLKDDGLCYFKYGGAWVNYVGMALGVVVLVVLVWVADMTIRSTSNATGLAQGMEHRGKCKIHMPADETGERKQFPLGTNMHTTVVAGPGMMLHFNFQAAVIVWAMLVGLLWMGFAQFVDKDLWRLGTRSFGTPRSNCILVAWGYETQQRLMWTKVLFLWIVYLTTCVMCFVFGVYQLRKYQDLDYQNKTMKDFAAMIVGLPAMKGHRPVEEELKKAVQDFTGQEVVGVSVAWNHKYEAEEVESALNTDREERLAECEPPPEAITDESSEPPAMNPVRAQFFSVEQQLFGLKPEDEAAEGGEQKGAKELLLGLRTAPRAVVVFNTEEGRDAALEKVRANGGLDLDSSGVVDLEIIDAEPDSVQWVNFGHSSTESKSMKILVGFVIIGLACLFWAVVFYAPYAYYVLTFNYENGRQPGFEVSIAFSMIVVVGNAIMYEVCGGISDWVGFRFRDHREACYLILYTIACMFNVALDFVTTYITAETVMESLGFRSYFGVPFHEIDAFTVKFETYGMQRSLAENTFSYAFPSTFLIPFLIEPVPTVLAPLFVGRLIVKSHPEVKGVAAEQWLEMLPMDMGRYGDILLNIILGILIFYFPGGYTWTLFLGMAVSHVWIYIFDYYKVLREIPACAYVNFDTEWWAQAMLAPIIGIIAACLAFKSNCEPNAYCIKGTTLVLTCFATWLLHTIMHLAVLIFVIPKFGREPYTTEAMEGVTFRDVAKTIPSSWFTANPVHCLRSKHFYRHSPPCDHYIVGKEHLMRENQEIGCFFSAKEAKSGKSEC